MTTPFRPALAALLALGLALPAVAQDSAPAMPRVLTVTGTGHAAVAPDFASVNVGVITEADTAADALRDMSARLDAVMARLVAAGVLPEDMQTSQLMVNPIYDYSGSSSSGLIDGFNASSLLTVRVRDLANLGAVLDAVVQDGANQLNGVMFDLADRRPALDIAREAAVADARHRAELYATAAGVTLGDLVSLSEQLGYGGPAPMYDARIAMEESVPVPIAAGEVNIEASVTMTWEIQ